MELFSWKILSALVTSHDGKNLFSMECLHLPKPVNSKPSISITLCTSTTFQLLSSKRLEIDESTFRANNSSATTGCFRSRITSPRWTRGLTLESGVVSWTSFRSFRHSFGFSSLGMKSTGLSTSSHCRGRYSCLHCDQMGRLFFNIWPFTLAHGLQNLP